MKKILFSILLIVLTIPDFVNAQKKVIVEEPTVETVNDNSKKVIKRKVAIGRFSNETEYGKGLFYDKDNDPMGKQALDILSAKLGASGKFILLERNDLQQLLEEANRNGQSAQQAIGADYMIIGSITEFGRKNTSQSQVFTTSKTQTVEAAVSIRLVDVATGQIIYSDQGKGSAEITTKSTFVGTGGHAGYDATLSDKAISAALSQLVENIINKCMDKPWKSYIVSVQDDSYVISGGTSQGLAAGDRFFVYRKGKVVKNPQTGIDVELPGTKIGEVIVQSSFGDTPETELSFCRYEGETLDTDNLMNYYIMDK